MPKRYKILVCICTIAVFSLVFTLHFNEGSRVQADAVGVVNVSGCLNVRTGPGTSYSLLKSGGTGVTLTTGQRVSIIAKSGKWYHISFKLNGRKLKGYVMGSYVKVQGGNVCTSVLASVVSDGIKLRKTASEKGEYVTSGKEQVVIPADLKVTITKEETAEKQKWYYISFQYSGKTCKGYVKAESLEISYGDGIPGIWEGSSKTPLYKNAGKSKAVENAGKNVNIGIGKQFTIIREKAVSEERYFYIKVRAGSSTVYGYLPALSARFQIVKTEAGSSGKTTTAPTAAPKVTGTPEATATPEVTEAPKATETPKTTETPDAPADTAEPSATPSPAPTAAPLSDDEFKKMLQDEGFTDSYINPLMELHAKYPKWEFKAFNTGLKWNTVIKKESVVGTNLLSINKSYEWKSTEEGAYDWKTDQYIPYDGSTWVTASAGAVRYYMDPRNFLDERGIFQFENLEYQSSSQTQEGVEKILNNTPMHDKKFSYTTSDGSTAQMKYSKAFMKAAEASNVSPYHLASRVKQEVVINSTLMSSSVSGTVPGYEGLYNFYNIGAYDSTEAGGAIANGLKWAGDGTAYNRPWTDHYKAITGGAEYIGKNYINVGQNTLYLEKFNVTSKNRYEHQYMTNIEAPNSEATKTVSAYGVIDADMPITFSIPVYNNMPDEPCAIPAEEKNPNNYLKTLYVQNYPFTSKFVLGDDGSKTYELKVDKSVENIKICATKVSQYATITGKGSKDLAEGLNTFTVKVTSESGNTRKYKIEVTRGE